MIKKYVLLFAFFLPILFSCTKDNHDKIILNDNIRLTGEYNNGQVILSWNLPNIYAFQFYEVIRETLSGNQMTSYDQLGFITQFEETTFTDSIVPSADTVIYFVRAIGSDTSVRSNTLEITPSSAQVTQ